MIAATAFRRHTVHSTDTLRCHFFATGPAPGDYP
jgi:hypothetical protein